MFRWRYRPFQTDLGHLAFTHVHNDYLQIAVEWGLPLAIGLWLSWAWSTTDEASPPP